MTPARWAVIGISLALVAAFGSLAAVHPDALAQIVDMGRTYLGR